jgi:hemerythrin
MAIYKEDLSRLILLDNDEVLVSWSDNLSTGIEMVDKQHRHLVALTNQLSQACRHGGNVRDIVFKETMSRVVEYIHFHFECEQKLLQNYNYPHYAEHKSEHDSLVKKVLETTKDYAENKRFVPNNFARFLRSWIVGHIAHEDKKFGLYVTALKTGKQFQRR